MTAQLETRQTLWVDVCRYADLLPERGAAALIDGVQVAIFRLADGDVLAIDNRDPFSGANVLSRGIVGSRGEIATVASLMHKQVFDLRAGLCLDDPTMSVRTHACRVEDGLVQVASP